ncbi:MAG TPA: amidohydrolase [Tenuifilaceae bacterium]|nr:amidohydrolase [Tenuifilaceae bacterium]HPE17399.1 amidohydrolase [Tenuifilaceae bacterium]HPJ46126.1 amidohydrolase [Tenuifilaceae bacterium]HPQ34549.1 amidohydrolase [Tenuifilaceae bacterium]
MKDNLNIVIIQADLHWEDKQKNFEKFSGFLSNVKPNQDIVLLPEMFTTGFSMNPKHLAENADGKTLKWMQQAAKLNGFAIGGSIIIEENDNFYNRFFFVTPQGEIHQYDKRHLFRMGNENQIYTNGSERVIVEYCGWRIMLNICYDLRFPVWSRNTGDYDLLVNVANFPGSRRIVWNTLLSARAIENQCYVAAANRIGTDGMNISYTGDSQILNARGQVISQAPQNEETAIYATLSMDELKEFREKFPVLLDVDSFTINI